VATKESFKKRAVWSLGLLELQSPFRHLSRRRASVGPPMSAFDPLQTFMINATIAEWTGAAR
jgi:hypothetical protein